MSGAIDQNDMFIPFTHRQKRTIFKDEDLRRVPGLEIKVRWILKILNDRPPVLFNISKLFNLIRAMNISLLQNTETHLCSYKINYDL